MGRLLIYNIVRFIIMVLLQVVVFKNIGYYNLISPFPYIIILLLLPIGTPNFIVFLLAFLTGLSIDAFYDTLGVHAAASVCLALFRIFFHKITLEVDFKDSFITPTLGEMGIKWFISYAFFGTLTHHFALYTLEVFSFSNFLYTMASIVLSSIFTLILILLISLLFYRKKSYLNN